jgi:hypothetical protein
MTYAALMLQEVDGVMPAIRVTAKTALPTSTGWWEPPAKRWMEQESIQVGTMIQNT